MNFTGNSASRGGAAALSHGSSVTIGTCLFWSNTAKEEAGALFIVVGFNHVRMCGVLQLDALYAHELFLMTSLLPAI